MNIYYQRFMDLLVEYNLYDEEAYNYLRKHSIMFDYLDDEWRNMIGCSYQINNNKLVGIWLTVPYINSDITALINIHEFTHGFIAYKKLDKKFIVDESIEMLPMAMEKLYAKKYANDILNKYELKLDDAIDNNSQLRYQLGLKYRDELMTDLNNGKSINRINRKTRRLVKKG